MVDRELPPTAPEPEPATALRDDKTDRGDLRWWEDREKKGAFLARHNKARDMGNDIARIAWDPDGIAGVGIHADRKGACRSERVAAGSRMSKAAF